MRMLRWAVDVGRWSPAEAEYQWLLSVLPVQDRQDCAKYLHADDRCRAVVSRLLQQKCVCACLGIGIEQVKLHRTSARKPFCVNKFPSELPNFNYNASHEVGTASR
jgi:phosphopantetheinyl transferase